MIDGQTLLNFALVLLFVLIGGVFAATELALVSLRESQINRIEDRGPRGARVAAVARNPNRFLAAVQIGVTVSGFFSAAYGGSRLAPDIAPHLEDLGLPQQPADTVALVSMTLLIAYLSLVLGELVPKRIALQRSAGLSMVTAPVLDRFATLMRPIIWLLSVSTNAVMRLLGGDPSATNEDVSEEELRDIVSSHEGLGDDERQILEDVFAATQRTVKEVMRPRGEVEFMSGDLTLAEAAELARAEPYSRYPVTGENFDEIIGFLHVRDLMLDTVDGSQRVREVAREILMLPATKAVLPAVSMMRAEKTHIAVVVDEYGGTDGIVTLEDLIEEIVGDIRDEYDAPPEDTDPQGTPGPDGSRSLPGGLSIEDFAKRSGVELEDGDYETVAGFVVFRLGRVAEVGDVVPLEEVTLRVSEIDGLRITRITLDPGGTASEEPTQEPD